jgi:hypothetical protein
MIPKDSSYAKESGEEVWDDIVEGIMEISSKIIFIIEPPARSLLTAWA